MWLLPTSFTYHHSPPLQLCRPARLNHLEFPELCSSLVFANNSPFCQFLIYSPQLIPVFSSKLSLGSISCRKPSFITPSPFTWARWSSSVFSEPLHPPILGHSVVDWNHRFCCPSSEKAVPGGQELPCFLFLYL